MLVCVILGYGTVLRPYHNPNINNHKTTELGR